MSGDALSWRSPQRYWSVDLHSLFADLRSGDGGLSGTEADDRLRVCGPNLLREANGPTRFDVLGRQLRSPLLLLLVFAAAVSVIVGEWLDATILAEAVVPGDVVALSAGSLVPAADGSPLAARCVFLGTNVRSGTARYLVVGDGVNDAPATHAADTSVSVDHAVNVAREAGLGGVETPPGGSAGAVGDSRIRRLARAWENRGYLPRHRPRAGM